MGLNSELDETVNDGLIKASYIRTQTQRRQRNMSEQEREGER